MLEGGVSEAMRNLSQTMDEATHEHQVMTLYYQLVAAEGSANAQSTSMQNPAKAIASAQMAFAIFAPFVSGSTNENSDNGRIFNNVLSANINGYGIEIQFDKNLNITTLFIGNYYSFNGGLIGGGSLTLKNGFTYEPDKK